MESHINMPTAQEGIDINNWAFCAADEIFYRLNVHPKLNNSRNCNLGWIASSGVLLHSSLKSQIPSQKLPASTREHTLVSQTSDDILPVIGTKLLHPPHSLPCTPGFWSIHTLLPAR